VIVLRTGFVSGAKATRKPPWRLASTPAGLPPAGSDRRRDSWRDATGRSGRREYSFAQPGEGALLARGWGREGGRGWSRHQPLLAV